MNQNLLSRGLEFLRRKMWNRRWQKAVTCLSAVVVFGVIYALVLPAITMTGKYPALSAETLTAWTGDELAVKVSAETAPEDGGKIIVLTLEGEGADLSQNYAFNEEGICVIIDEAQNEIELHRAIREKVENTVDYWFAMEPGTHTVFTLNLADEVDAARFAETMEAVKVSGEEKAAEAEKATASDAGKSAAVQTEKKETEKATPANAEKKAEVKKASASSADVAEANKIAENSEEKIKTETHDEGFVEILDGTVINDLEADEDEEEEQTEIVAELKVSAGVGDDYENAVKDAAKNADKRGDAQLKFQWKDVVAKQAAAPELISYLNGATIAVFYDEKAGIPAGAALSVREIEEGTDEYAEYLAQAKSAMDKATDSDASKTVTQARFFDITILDEGGEEVEPQTAVKVVITYDEAVEVSSDGDLNVVHFKNDDTQEVFAPVKPEEKQEVDALAFTTDSFSVFGVVSREVIVTTFTAGDGSSYEVVVDYGEDAGVPRGASLRVAELTEADPSYNTYVEKTAEKIDSDVSELNYIRLLDISIMDKNGEKVALTAPVDVQIRLLDKPGVDDLAQVVHFAEDKAASAEVPEVLECAAKDDVVSFKADGFSVYAIVSGPLATPAGGWRSAISGSEIEALTSKGVSLYIWENSNKWLKNTADSTGIETETGTAPADIENYKYYFEKVAAAEGEDDPHLYRIYCLNSSGGKQYVKTEKPNNTKPLTFTDSEQDATSFKLSFSSTGEVRFATAFGDSGYMYYWARSSNSILNKNCYDSSKKTIDPTKGALFRILYKSDDGDPYGLDGKSYSILRWDGGDTAKALTSNAHEDKEGNLCADFLTVMSHNGESTDRIYVPNDIKANITSWKFSWVDGNNYKLSTTVDGAEKYLKIDQNGLRMVEVAEASNITVTVQSGIHAGQIMLSTGTSGSKRTLTYSGTYANGFNTNASTPGLEWLYLAEAEPEAVIDNYYSINSAKKISVSDSSLLPQNKDDKPKKIILYTRVWNGHGYTYFAIDGNGKLVPATENGDSIQWIGSGTDELLWDFTVYGSWKEDTFTPSNYYEFQNATTKKYLAPLMAIKDEDGNILKEAQILSDSTIGVVMPGRKNGQYYSQTLVWDAPNYAFAGITVDLDAGEGAAIEACHRTKALDIYFAVVEPKNPDDELHTVPTVDNDLYGIEMYMVNFDGKTPGGGCDTTAIQTYYLGKDKYEPVDQTSGLLSTDLKKNGYPEATETKRDLGKLYNGSGDGYQSTKKRVNHLFIQSTYDATGYYVYDSTQNYATLYPSGGSYTGDFTVYQGIGTYDKAYDSKISPKPSLKHGQFFPYNSIHAGLYADPTVNGLNLYTTTQQPLPEDDPRYGEKLYLLTKPGISGSDIYKVDNQHPDYWLGMEMEAGFVQTPSGLDDWGHDIIFEFSGDDDFWLYVDGELIIDLGGIHGALPASVNFRTGEVEVNESKTSLYELFHDHYIARGMSEEKAQQKLYGHGVPGDADYEPGIFEDKVDPDHGSVTVFKDNTNHTMKIFYMERGAGASNLYMRFNLSAVKKGTVQLTKELKEIKGDEVVDISKDSIAVYPYQIYYDDPRTATEDLVQLKNDGSGEVKYLGTTQNVPYKDVLDVDHFNSTTGKTERIKYEDVFLVHPGETIEITFPEFGEGADGSKLYVEKYYIVECGVDPDIYQYVNVNNNRINPTPVSTKYYVDENGDEHEQQAAYVAHLKNFKIPIDTLDARATVVYDNVVKETKKMTIQKELYKKQGEGHDPELIKLYKENGDPIDPKNPDLLRTFDFRLSFKTPYDNDFNPANIYSYHVIDPAGYYCKWLAANPEHTDPNDPESVGKFVRIQKGGQPVTDLSVLSEEEKLSCTFDTSMNGAIAQIPAYYRVEIVGLLPGTQYNVVERPTETPDGYQFWQYVLNGVPYDLSDTNNDEHIDAWDGITGTIPSQGKSEVLVRNYKGYALRLLKVWADASTVKNRDPAYFAVYYETTNEGVVTDRKLLPGSVRQLAYNADPQELLWSWLNLPAVPGIDKDNLDFHKYVVREVVLKDPDVDENGNVTYNGSPEPVEHLPVTLRTKTNAGADENVRYRVEYADPVEIGDNYREFTVSNTPVDRPAVLFYKEDWSDNPLGDAAFTLYHGNDPVWSVTENETVTAVAKTSRASDGWIATEFLTKDEEYTLTETEAPQGYIGLKDALKIKLTYDKGEKAWKLTVDPDSEATGGYYDVDHEIKKNDQGVITEEYFKVTIKDRPYELKVLKTERGTEVPVEGAEFELWKDNPQSTGSTRWEQVTWTESGTDVKTIISGTDGIIPRLDNTLAPGTYQLRETKAPDNYLSLTEEYKNDQSQNYGYINFTISSLGVITLGDHPDVVGLTDPAPDGEAVYKLKIPNKPLLYEVKLKKVDEKQNDLKGSKFELTQKVGENWVAVDLDPDKEGNQNEIDLTTIFEKTFKLRKGFYRLKETKTPDGYIICNPFVYFTMAKGVVSLTDENGSAVTGDNNPYVALNNGVYTDIIEPGQGQTIYTIRVWNYPGIELPNTGGPGTLLYTLGGLALVAGSALIYRFRIR